MTDPERTTQKEQDKLTPNATQSEMQNWQQPLHKE